MWLSSTVGNMDAILATACSWVVKEASSSQISAMMWESRRMARWDLTLGSKGLNGHSNMELETPEGRLVGLQGVELEPCKWPRGKVQRCMAPCSHLCTSILIKRFLLSDINHLRCDHSARVGTCGSVVHSSTLS